MQSRTTLAELRRRHPQYAESAYVFLLAALQRCLEELERPRHVSGAEVAGAVRDLALDRYGPMARTVLKHWGVTSTADLGEIVFLLVEEGILIKEPTDTREDFQGLFSFEEAFEHGYPWSVLEGDPSG